ncbi:HypC/HybG/HupF family hydrogenase formation chaperone [Spirillospora albida]|uniref:HypC/HybG/HupF family hydrogenase formation chaperone n=1 Tax=Spirillospora albida TaxID=58123 RepID=UPI0004C1846E|nr:HypC/HybG/HupF family hydrogenase formation chaperone [Spirillospora albida]
MCLEQIGRVSALSGDGTAVAVFEGIERSVSLVVLDAEGVPLAPGDWLAAHSGIAVRRLGEDEAAEHLRWRREADGRLP